MELNVNKKRNHGDQDARPNKKHRSSEGSSEASRDSISPSPEEEGTGLELDQSGGFDAEPPALFADLKLSERTMAAIETMGFETMTEIQRRVRGIPTCTAQVLSVALTRLLGYPSSPCRQRLAGRSQDGLRENTGFPCPCCRDPQRTSLQAAQRMWRNNYFAHSRIGPSDLRRRQRAVRAAFADFWNSHGRSEPAR